MEGNPAMGRIGPVDPAARTQKKFFKTAAVGGIVVAFVGSVTFLLTLEKRPAGGLGGQLTVKPSGEVTTVQDHDEYHPEIVVLWTEAIGKYLARIFEFLLLAALPLAFTMWRNKDADHRAMMAELALELNSYRESHTVHDDDVEQLKEDIATKGKHIDDLQGNLDALKKEYEDSFAKIEKQLQVHLEERRSEAEKIASANEKTAREEKRRLDESRLKLDSYRESHTVHDDDVEQLKEDIATKGKHIDDLQGRLDALKKTSNDRDMLVFFRSTGGANWSNKTNWGTDNDLATWYGVEANDQGRVLKLELDENNLRGAIPAQLGALTKLTWLDLPGNYLHGPIPPELGKLTALVELRLWNNKLSGPIPKELGALRRLEKLLLHRNNLTGPIPSELGHLSALKELYLSNNQLSGPIPKELGALSALKALWLGGNQLSGTIPSELRKLTLLLLLNLGGNQLSGPIPPELGKLTALVELLLRNNKLSGYIPPELGALSELRVLSLDNNKLTGTVPEALGELTAPKYFHLYSNYLSGPLPPKLAARFPGIL